MFSRATVTALGVLHQLVARHEDDGRSTARDLAESGNLPAAFVSKVLTSLCRAGIVRSVRGPGGGFVLARPPESISLAEVHDLFETAEMPVRCPFTDRPCNDDPPCALHRRFDDLRKHLRAFLESSSLDDLRLAETEAL